jgi:plastocyanin
MGKRVVGLALAAAVFCLAASAASARTKVVYAGGPVAWQNSLGRSTGAGVDNYLIDRVTINAGDTVIWNGKSLSNGFHTVDIPALGGSDLPLFTPTGKMVTNVLDAGGSPFWFNGKVPQLGFDPQLFAPIGGHVDNGSSRIDSGLPLGPPANFAVKFTKPGVYKFYCDVHYGMVGYVVVKPHGKPVPTAAQDAATLRGEELAYTTEARHVDRTTAPASSVSLGASGPGGLEVFAMFPATLRVHPGTTVRFFMSRDTRETHTASFGSVSYLKPLAQSFTGAVPAAQAIYPSDPPGHIVLTPASHGNGFASTGALDRDSGTPLSPAGTITFSKPGTYHFVCLIHPFMHGTIVVK